MDTFTCSGPSQRSAPLRAMMASSSGPRSGPRMQKASTPPMKNGRKAGISMANMFTSTLCFGGLRREVLQWC